MKKTDISDYDYTEIPEHSGTKYASAAGSAVKHTFLLIWRTFVTLIAVLFVAGIIIGVSMVIYIASIAREPTGIDLHSAKLNETSYIYTYNDQGRAQQYMQLYTSENRVMVEFDDIPQYMKDAIVAIEDKRFYEHQFLKPRMKILTLQKRFSVLLTLRESSPRTRFLNLI